MHATKGLLTSTQIPCSNSIPTLSISLPISQYHEDIYICIRIYRTYKAIVAYISERRLCILCQSVIHSSNAVRWSSGSKDKLYGYRYFLRIVVIYSNSIVTILSNACHIFVKLTSDSFCA